MANILRIKRRVVGGAAGAPASLKNAELAFNEVDDTLYYGKGDNGSGDATTIPAIAGLLTVHQSSCTLCHLSNNNRNTPIPPL